LILLARKMFSDFDRDR